MTSDSPSPRPLSEQPTAPLPTRVWEGLPQMNPDPIIAEVEADPRAFEWTTLALVAEIRRLRARPQEGAADSARLDWLSENAVRVVPVLDMDPDAAIGWRLHPEDGEEAIGATLRQAIDAARGADATATPPTPPKCDNCGMVQEDHAFHGSGWWCVGLPFDAEFAPPSPHSTANGGGGSN